MPDRGGQIGKTAASKPKQSLIRTIRPVKDLGSHQFKKSLFPKFKSILYFLLCLFLRYSFLKKSRHGLDKP